MGLGKRTRIFNSNKQDVWFISSSSGGVIAGAVIGGIVGVLLISSIVVCVCVKICKKTNHGQVLVYPQQPVFYTNSGNSFFSDMIINNILLFKFNMRFFLLNMKKKTLFLLGGVGVIIIKSI